MDELKKSEEQAKAKEIEKKNNDLMQLVKNELSNCLLNNMTLTVEVNFLLEKNNSLSVENNRLIAENKILTDAMEKNKK